MLSVCTKGLSVTQFQFSVCMYGTCGRIDNKADIDFDFDFDHLKHLHRFLSKICKAGLTLNVSKCEWAKQVTSYFGFQLGNCEVRHQVDKVEGLGNCPRPLTKKEVRSFIGLVGWYRHFIPQFSSIAVPLINLTTKAVKNPVPWTEECEQAFTQLKHHICTSRVLKSPDFTKRFVVQMDASVKGLEPCWPREISA